MINQDILKNVLSCLNQHAFAKYVFGLYKLSDDINDTNFQSSVRYTLETVDLSKTCGEYVFERHHHNPPEFQGFEGIFIYTEPIDLFNRLSDVDIATPTITNNLKKYNKFFNKRTKNWYWPLDGELMGPTIAFVTNYSGIDRDYYDKILFPKFSNLINHWEIVDSLLQVGSIDSFIELNRIGAEKAFTDFMSMYKDGLSISLSEDRFTVNDFLADTYISSGVLRNSKNPCESIFLNPIQKNQILLEFEYLINSNPKESELESFLKRYYQEIFGFEYDKIETQLWLRFPELDISHNNRRLDIFLRNSIQNDWELFEVKRTVKLTSSYRNVPVFTNEVQNAIQQLRNYNSILSQDKVKRKMANEGIEYYVPTLNLVIGRSPNILPAQWRWLKSTNEKDVKIITYDELLKSMKTRSKYHLQYLQNL